MTLAERRLNESILRSKILKELSFLLENFGKLNEIDQDFFSMSPGESTSEYEERQQTFRKGQQQVLDTVSNFLSDRGKEFHQAWKEFIHGVVNDRSLFLKASNLAWQDIKILAEKDPASLICWVLDFISLFDPTGIADIIQGGILIGQGAAEGSGLSIFFGAVCLVAGFLTAQAFLATIGTAGAATPVLVLAKASAITIKQLTVFSIRQFIKLLNKGGDFIISSLRKMRGFDKRAVSQVENIIKNSKNMPSPRQGETAEELIKNLTGMEPGATSVSPLTQSGRQQIINAAKQKVVGAVTKIADASPQLAGFALSTSMTASEGEKYRMIDRAYEIMNKQYCVLKRNKELCDDIEIDDKYRMKFSSKTGDFGNIEGYKAIFQDVLKNIEKQEGKLISPGPGDPEFVGPVVPEGGPPADAIPINRASQTQQTNEPFRRR